MKEEIEKGSLIKRYNRLLKARITIVVTFLVIFLSPTELFSMGVCYSPSVQGPAGKAFGRLLKSLKKTRPAFREAGKTYNAVRAGGVLLQKTMNDSTYFSTNRGYQGFYKTQDFKVNPYVGPYNQWQTSRSLTNPLDTMNLEMKVRGYHVGNNGNVDPFTTPLQTSPAPSVTNPVDSLELQLKMRELKKSIEYTRKSFNGKLK